MPVSNSTGLSNKRAGILFLSIMTVCLGIIPSVIGILFANLHMADWPAVPATIVGHSFRDGMGNPIYEYVVDGQVFQHLSDTARNPPVPIGTVRELRVDPTNPGRAGAYRPAFLFMTLGLPLGIGLGWLGYRAFSKRPDIIHPDVSAPYYYDSQNGYPPANSERDDQQDERIRRLEEELQMLRNQRNAQTASDANPSEPKLNDDWWRS